MIWLYQKLAGIFADTVTGNFGVECLIVIMRITTVICQVSARKGLRLSHKLFLWLKTSAPLGVLLLDITKG
jgi:hypothetical protein